MSAKFRRKSLVVEAVQFDPSGAHKQELPPGVFVTAAPGHADNYGYSGFQFAVTTIHGHLTPIIAGDWIMPERDGIHFYPCKPDVFEATYEVVPTEKAATSST